jgi:signal transduction histidine kinase
VVVILGSFTIMGVGRMHYLNALASTVMLTAGAVLLIALAWNPRAGFAGLNVFFSRYLFSIGLPLEKWLHFLAELSQLEARPQRFLAEAVGALARLPWISGATWRTSDSAGEQGPASPHSLEFENSALSLKIFSRYRMSPALNWHLHLLGLLLGEFYVAKLREEELRQTSYLQAVHETGARMTHDIKNLLQSLNVLCAAAARDGAQTWWDGLVRQYRSEGVELDSARLPPSARLPRSLFDNVADNLIRNALAKRVAERGPSVRVDFEYGDGVTLRVRDTGSAVPPEIESTLLRAPVSSHGGLGIGLYQAARLAESKGYRLALESNRDGDVCFALSGPAS